MPRMENNGGDVLARGAASATFKPAGANLSKEKWEAIWGSFDPEAFKNAPPPKDPNAIKATSSGGFAEPENAETGSDSGSASTGTSSVDAGTPVESV